MHVLTSDSSKKKILGTWKLKICVIWLRTEYEIKIVDNSWWKSHFHLGKNKPRQIFEYILLFELKQMTTYLSPTSGKLYVQEMTDLFCIANM